MATSPAISSSFLPAAAVTPVNRQQLFFFSNLSTSSIRRTSDKRLAFKVQAAKLPAGVSKFLFLFLGRILCFSFKLLMHWSFETQVELPKQQPKFQPPFLGFTRTAEIWNSRACMIGLIGTFIVELVSILVFPFVNLFVLPLLFMVQVV